MAGDATALIGIDWGTSRQRAYRIDSHGHLLESRSGELGLSAVRGKDFDAALQPLVLDWLKSAGDIPLLMCGMIGSRNGWREAPYRDCPFGIEELSQTIVPITTACGEAYIVGGGHGMDARGHHDVMRGEETQFLGLEDGISRRLAIAPGTHSKWAHLEGGQVMSFRTYMTGEIFALLKEHSILGWLMPGAEMVAVDAAVFADGVQDAAANGDMLHGLFHVRAVGLFHPERIPTLASYLSGLLIGYEVSAAMKTYAAAPVVLLAAPHLAQLYALALTSLGARDVRSEDVDAVTARGLWRIWQARKDAS